jgi:hypothetical protein|tara:strand:- start:145 stop:384 length:240 start_codon:yes stop_codon:yes gene_type:complete
MNNTNTQNTGMRSNKVRKGGEAIGAGTLHGGEAIGKGTLHGAKELQPGTLHGGEAIGAGTLCIISSGSTLEKTSTVTIP